MKRLIPITYALREALDYENAPLPKALAEKLTARGIEHDGTYHSAARATFADIERRRIEQRRMAAPGVARRGKDRQ